MIRTPRLLFVSPTDEAADFRSITEAAASAVDGDTLLLGPGRYARSTTHERFPICIPRGVAVVGSDKAGAVIDGEGALELTWQPMRAEQSLLVLADRARLARLTITRSGGSGVGISPRARVSLSELELTHHALHGILSSGADEAEIFDSVFDSNGALRATFPLPSRVQPAQPGQDIYVMNRSGSANRVQISRNKLTRAGADAIAVNCFTDEGDRVTARIVIRDNVIERTARHGLSLFGSFGPRGNELEVTVTGNVFRELPGAGITAAAACAAVHKEVRDTTFRLEVQDNRFEQLAMGLVLFGALGPARGGRLSASCVGNHFSDIKAFAARVVGGVAYLENEVHDSAVELLFARNTLERIGQAPLLLQGAAPEAPGDAQATGNRVVAQVAYNRFVSSGSQVGIVVNHGLAGNEVRLEAADLSSEPRPGVLPVTPGAR